MWLTNMTWERERGKDYLDQQTALESHQSYPQPQPQPHPQPDTTATTAAQIKVHNNDFIGSAAYNIVAGVTVATIFGAAFFFDLFWPERHEDTGVRRAWCACAMLACAMMGSSAVVMTVVTAGHRARISASSSAGGAWTVPGPGPGPQLVYRLNPKAVAAVVLAWPGAVFTLIRYFHFPFPCCPFPVPHFPIPVPCRLCLCTVRVMDKAK